MTKKMWGFLVGLIVFSLFAGLEPVVNAQMSPAQEKPPMYSYVANWVFPRAQWPEVEKGSAATQKTLQDDLANGTIVGYGNEESLVHQLDGSTHDNWWSSMSMAGLMKVLQHLAQSGGSSTNDLNSATKHWDNIYVSRYYSYHSGPFKNAYTNVSTYKLKKDAPDDALDLLSKNVVAPLLEKMLADGTIIEYEIDTPAVHTEAPGVFSIVYICPQPEGLDKVNAAIRETLKAHPLEGPAFGAMTDLKGHRDELVLTTGAYK